MRSSALLFASLISAVCSAQQLYETPESRRRDAELAKQLEEQKQREAAAAAQARKPTLEQKREQASAFVGRRFWYLPNPNATRRIRFYERVPPSSYSEDPRYLFRPLTITNFVVTDIVMPPSTYYAIGTDEYLLRIEFPDGKIGYVNYLGCCGILENMYADMMKDDAEYVAPYVETETVEELLSKEAKRRADIWAAQQRAIQAEERERAEAQQREAAERAAAEKDRARRDAAHRNALAAAERERERRRAMPSPRIGMSRDQVVNQTNWGRPHDINRTTTARGVREQWVYGTRRYLYFDDGILTGIQD